MTLLLAVRMVRICFALILIWTLFYMSIRKLLLDTMRQHLFAIRDALFDFALDGGIEFDDPSYRELRDDINNLIRFGDKTSLMRMLVASLFIRNDEPAKKTIEEWMARVNQLPPLARRKLLETRAEAVHEVIVYIVRRSVIAFVLISILRIVGLLNHTTRNFIRRVFASVGQSLEVQANEKYRLAS